MQENILEELGLTKTEAKVYLALVKLGLASATDIARKINSYRRNVYDFLDKLVDKGLVSSVVVGKKRYYEAAQPDRLLSVLKEKEESLLSILPEMNENYKLSKSKESVNVYKGKEGLKTVFEEILKVKKRNILLIGGAGRTSYYLKYYYPWFNKKRIKQGIRINAIFSELVKDKKEVKDKLMQSRFLPKKYTSPISLLVFDDSVAEFVWGEMPLIVLIESRTAVKGITSYFNLIWKIAKK